MLFGLFYNNLYYLQGDYVWISVPKGQEFNIPIGAQIVHQELGKTQLRDDEGQVRNLFLNQKSS